MVTHSLTHIESTPLPGSLESNEKTKRQGGATVMKTAIKYVAMDVHQASIVSTIRDESRKFTMRATLETKAGPILEFLEGLRGRVWLVFEEGTQSQWLHDLVVRRVEKVVVCDPRQIHEKGNKGDRPDADRLSELLRLGGLRSVYKGSPGGALSEGAGP